VRMILRGGGGAKDVTGDFGPWACPIPLDVVLREHRHRGPQPDLAGDTLGRTWDLSWR
jgi:hypothetical protein